MISIITVVYNGEKTIRETLESVCTQTELPFEYIIIDGGSTDATVKIITEFAFIYPFIKLVSEKDNGIYDAMNKGISLARGRIVGILNSDDWYEADALEKITEAYNRNGSGVYCGFLRSILDDKEFYAERVSHQFLGRKMIPHPSTFISLDIYKRFGCFNLAYRYSADLELFARLINKQVTFFYLDYILTNFRLGGASSSSDAAIESTKIRKKYGLITTKEYFKKILKLKLSSLFN
jgi:glycosyltransferase involved in cell wall biosynthesis